MADHDHQSRAGNHIAHAFMGLGLKCQITSRKHLVDQQDFGINGGGDAEGADDI